MRIWLLSDLHLDAAPQDILPEAPEADVCVVAGDVCEDAARGVAAVARMLPEGMEAIYVAGNHEFWGSSVPETIEEARNAAREHPSVHFLENDSMEIGGVTFAGATLWTDFRLGGHRELAMAHARDAMRDYRRVSLRKWPWKRLLPRDTARMHDGSRAFLRAATEGVTGKSVIVTHHAPHPGSVPGRYRDDPATPAYASDLTDIIEACRPSLWVHGHVHQSADHRVSATRIVCNPRGYGHENLLWDPAFVVEI